ncbi:MAG: hypothetical protein ACXW27_10385 [Allosphingosinicella sp.]
MKVVKVASTKASNHSRVPLMRMQIQALRQAAQSSSDAEGSDNWLDTGTVLTSNMLLGFALELGLKLFYATYHEKAAHGHDLTVLYEGLPDQIRGDISESYATSIEASTPGTIKLYAFRVSKDQPPVPEGPSGGRYDSAAELFKAVSLLFVRARYFFEQVNSEDWAVMAHPIDHVLLMSGVLDVVYDEYLQRGSWA